MNYVEQREAELKAKFQSEMWWIGISKLWTKLAEAMTVKREADYYTEKFNAIRAQYIRKGRPVGWRAARKQSA